MNPGMINMLLQSIDLEETNKIISENAPMIIEEIDKEVFKDVTLNEDEEQPALLYVKKDGETFGMVITLPPNFFDAQASTIKVKRRIGLMNIKDRISKVKIQAIVDKFFK